MEKIFWVEAYDCVEKKSFSFYGCISAIEEKKEVFLASYGGIFFNGQPPAWVGRAYEYRNDRAGGGGMNPCLREFFEGGGVIETEGGDDGEYRPLINHHAPGCDGKCNFGGELGLPPAVVEWCIQGGASHAFLWMAPGYDSTSGLLEAIEMAKGRGWIVCSSDARFPWGNEYGDDENWFRTRFGETDMKKAGYKKAAAYDYCQWRRPNSKTFGDSEVVAELKRFT